MLSMFEQLFEKNLSSAVGSKVVDDSRSISISVIIPEGKATFIEVDAPSSFTPGVPFRIRPKVRNDGSDDTLFMSLTDTDTGEVLKHPSAYTYYAPSGQTWTQSWEVTLDQLTDFHGLIEVGHVV